MSFNGEKVPHRLFGKRVTDREIAELIGFCRGILADGIVTEDESVGLAVWLSSHPAAASGFPGMEISAWVRRVFEDHIPNADELAELRDMLRALTGSQTDDHHSGLLSTTLPLDDPAPKIVFENREFVFTGHFCMPRKECAERVTYRRGIFWNDVREKTNYLVIGTVASEAWSSSAFGRKIEAAEKMKRSGHPIAIVSERHWLHACS